jgi:glycerol-3-phosphate dehydrogenase
MIHTFSALDRSKHLRDMEQVQYDLLVIGGGITGAGIALDAQSRGIQTALIEMQDFAAGTSSRSTKLVHGGLRYLKQFEVVMVAEVGKERAIVYENGPHVTTPEWMILPIYIGGTFGKFTTSIGLRVYDFLAGVKKQERRRMLNVQETLSKLPSLKTDGLKGAGYYVEYRTDDARLTLEVLKRAVDYGAKAINYVKADKFIYRDNQIMGVEAVDQLTGEVYAIYAKKVVNATGPWVDTLREKDQSKEGKTLHLTKGIHLVLDGKRFPLPHSVYFDTTDGRMIFAIPRNGKTYVGTTDTNYKGDIAHPRMTVEDRDYLLQAVNSMFPQFNLVAGDVESSWTGLRPLIHQEGKDPSQISRKDEIFHSASGLLTIAGGKLTGYRKMAETIVNIVVKQLSETEQRPYPASGTKHMPISGGDVGGSEQYNQFVEEKVIEGQRLGLSDVDARLLVLRYGSNIDQLYAEVDMYRQEAEQYGLPLHLVLSIVYSIEHEMAVSPVDFFVRRTGALYFDMPFVQKWRLPVIAYMAQKLNWNDVQRGAYSGELDEEIDAAINPIGI